MAVKEVRGIAVAATLSMSAFSFQRILHAIIATRPLVRHFYNDVEARELKERGKSVDSFQEHFVPAIGYIVVPLLIAYLIAYWP
jgi:hypothetical protein